MDQKKAKSQIWNNNNNNNNNNKSDVDINIQPRYQTICQNHVKSDKQ